MKNNEKSNNKFKRTHSINSINEIDLIVIQLEEYETTKTDSKEKGNIESFEDESTKFHKKISLFLFLFGFIIIFSWLINVKYIKSEISYCKSLAIASLILFIIGTIILLPIVIMAFIFYFDYKNSGL